MTKRKECSPCLVCGATERTASHFGSTACMACASFFRRTVSFGIRFLCKARNNCTISSDIRFICRSCRFDNCMRAGMRKDLVQQKRDDSRVPKYVLESRKGGVTEVVRGYTTCNYINHYSELTSSSVSSASPSSTRSNSPETFEFSTILSISHDELLQFYTRQIQMALVQLKAESVESPYEQLLSTKRVTDQLALDLCSSCPGTDLLEKSDLEILYRYCSFASLWMDSAWLSSSNQNISCGDKQRPKEEDRKDVLLNDFMSHFESTITLELRRLQLDVVEYAALKSFCIWKLGILDSTLTLKIVAQEQYFGVTTALGKYYQTTKCMKSFEIATRLADITLILGPIFTVYQDCQRLYERLEIAGSMDD